MPAPCVAEDAHVFRPACGDQPHIGTYVQGICTRMPPSAYAGRLAAADSSTPSSMSTPRLPPAASSLSTSSSPTPGSARAQMHISAILCVRLLAAAANSSTRSTIARNDPSCDYVASRERPTLHVFLARSSSVLSNQLSDQGSVRWTLLVSGSLLFPQWL